MREPFVMLTHSPRSWARELHAHLMDHGGATVCGYVVGADDVRSESYDVLIADDITSFLTPRLVDDVRGLGRGVLGVFDPEEADGAGKRRLVELGVDEVIAGDAGVEALVDAISRVAEPFVDERTDLDELRRELASDPTRKRTVAPTPLIVVAGAGGGVGATEVAIQVATSVRRRRHAVVLVDANELSPSIAQRLGIAPHPNLLTAIDAHHQRDGQVSQTLHVDERLGIEVLPGTPGRRSPGVLRPGDVLGVIAELRRGGRTVVVDVSAHIEPTAFRPGPDRFALAGAVVAAATTVLLVGRPTPVGCRRIIEWLTVARRASVEAPVDVVVNGHSGGRYSTGEIIDELRRSYRVRSLHVAPLDKRLERAAWQGAVRSRGRFARAVARAVKAIDIADHGAGMGTSR